MVTDGLVTGRARRIVAMPQTLTPEQASFICNVVGVTALVAEHPVTKSVIAAIPADKADYRPNAVAKSAIDLAWHLAAAEIRFLDGVASGAFDFPTRGDPIRCGRPPMWSRGTPNGSGRTSND